MRRKNDKREKTSRRSVISMDFDWILFVIPILLSIFGLVCIFSATRTLNTNTNVIVQSGAFVIGVVMMLLTCFFDYEQFKNLSKPIYIFCVAILILVLLIGIGSDEVGAKSWIRFGSIGIQPSEIAKICFILTFSYHLSQCEKNINQPLTVIGLLIHLGVIILLVMMQPDLGSTLVFIFMFLTLMYVAKLSYKYIVPVGVIGISSLPLIYEHLNDFQKNRIIAFFNPESDPRGYGYNVIQSKVAVGSGQFWGKGFLSGTQNQLGLVPEKHTDFIFSIISEEFGFLGAVLVLIALFVLIYRCFRVAQKADNLYGRYICVGVGSMLLFHTFENAGMCIGLMPVTGIPLPFISYGGTAMVTNLIAIGLVMSVAYHNKPRSTFDVY